MNPWLFVILSPIAWALVNVYDKYLVEHRVKNVFSFAALSGMVSVSVGIIMMIMLDWSNVRPSSLMFPLISGGLLGLQLFVYYVLVKKSDISILIGLYYVYPLLVILLSFLFLGEHIAPIGYLGVVLVIVGTVLLSSRLGKVNGKILALMILIGAGSEFFIKLSTNVMPVWNGVALNFLAYGVIVLPAFLFKKVRQGFSQEVHNFSYVLGNECIALFGITLFYLSMESFPATIVSSVGASQPVFVLIFEKLFEAKYGSMVRDKQSLKKMIGILCVVCGVAVLYLVS